MSSYLETTRRVDLPRNVLLESVELVAMKTPVPDDGPCVFAGESAFYVGDEDSFDDGRGHILLRDVPLGVCRKTAAGAVSRDCPPLRTGRSR